VFIPEKEVMMPNRTFFCVFLFSLMLTVTPCVHYSNADNKATSPPKPGSLALSKDYLIGAGDVLGLEVWKDPNLTRNLVVLSDGKVNVPLIGEVIAADRTISDLKKEMEKRLSKFVPDPVITLEVKECNSLFIYVLGRVNSPGRFALDSSVNVLQGLAMAGGLNPFANRNQIKIFRTESGKKRVIPFRYDDVTKDELTEDNIDLKRGDVIYVP
jgi:polysaccharide export outer membrane protein